MNSIDKVNLNSGALTNSDAQNINRKVLSRQNNNGKKQNKKNTRSASNPVVEEMKIALQKEGLGNFIDMMA